MGKYTYIYFYSALTFLYLVVIIGFKTWVILNYPSVACEDVCIITKKQSISKKGNIYNAIYFAKQGNDFEHRMRLRNSTVFNMIAIGDTVSIYGSGEMDNYHYRFCEDYPGSKQYELWCANKP